mgnify:CR=1 FL=1|tara:strand:- start:7755 stop:8189 length:435 start_codon:yes stop_codon:yes gene_type:complete
MDKVIPDKWVRKAVFTALNNITVNGNTIKCYDTRVTGRNIPDHYILMSTQTNTTSKQNKCEWFYESSILIDIVTSYKLPGNSGSRLLADDILDSARNLTQSLALDVTSGLSIITQTDDFPNDISTTTENENIFRKFLRLELLIK